MSILKPHELMLERYWRQRGREVWFKHLDHMLDDNHRGCVECAVLVSRMEQPDEAV